MDAYILELKAISICYPLVLRIPRRTFLNDLLGFSLGLG